MKYFYDTEFIEDGKTIDLISIGVVAEDGRSYYAISTEFNPRKASQWVKDNVLAHLPPRHVNLSEVSVSPRLKEESRAWKSRRQIRNELLHFINSEYGLPEFWAYYADYDHVALCQLFGTMMDLPKGWPMYTRDVKQLCDAMGNPKLPEQTEDEHHALADARWTKAAYEFLLQQPATSERCGECGHNNFRADLGYCIATVKIDNYGAEKDCGCKCVVPATATPKQPLPTEFVCIDPPVGLDVLDYLNGVRGEIDSDVVLAHLNLCAQCAETARGLKEIDKVIRGGAGEDAKQADECQRRMDAVVEAAVAWHQSGREGNMWLDKAEELSAAINSLLELRDAPAATTTAEPPHNTCLACGEPTPDPYCAECTARYRVLADVSATGPAAPQDEPWMREGDNLCDPHVAAMDIIYNSTDPEHMAARLEGELNRWKDALIAERQPGATTTSDRVREAARIIARRHSDVFPNQLSVDAILAIISKYIPNAGEVERLKQELAQAYYVDCEICEQVIVSADGDDVHTFIVCGCCWNESQTKLRAARADVIRECANLARLMATGESSETGRQKALNIAAALESLLDKKEGEDGPYI